MSFCGRVDSGPEVVLNQYDLVNGKPTSKRSKILYENADAQESSGAQACQTFRKQQRDKFNRGMDTGLSIKPSTRLEIVLGSAEGENMS